MIPIKTIKLPVNEETQMALIDAITESTKFVGDIIILEERGRGGGQDGNYASFCQKGSHSNASSEAKLSSSLRNSIMLLQHGRLWKFHWNKIFKMEKT